MEGWEGLVGVGFLLVLAGIVLIVIGMIAGALRSGGGEAEAGAVVIIGPIPIIVGSSGRAALLAAVIGAVLMALALAMMLLLRRPPG